ncbi:Lipase [Drechslerella dactyloides]|uniref:Lipase n=1 Tax=Drechslerella dactyloides TaxID=74499 RepID=A0AAD6IR55_DREDA|nr:Lipase [Drechslerella dactyloides]
MARVSFASFVQGATRTKQTETSDETSTTSGSPTSTTTTTTKEHENRKLGFPLFALQRMRSPQPLIHLPGSGACASPTQKHSKGGKPTSSSPSSSPPKSVLNPLLNLVKHPGDAIRNFALDEVGKQRLVLQARLKNSYARHDDVVDIADPRLSQAKTHAEWIEAATLLDELDGNNWWKAESDSSEYDADQVKARLDQLEDARISGDIGRMLFLVRTTLTRHLGGMGNVELYRHSYTGTKYLIESYIETTLATLDALTNAPHSSDPQLSPKKILESLVATRQSFGRTALLLSGGATSGMTHIGVLKSLWEADLLPRIISGASAGAIVASVLCVRTDNEIPHTLENFPYGELDVFDRVTEPEGVFARVSRLLKIGAWIDIANLTRVMRSLLGDITFQEAYNRTRRILNICVSPASVYELPQLLNYLTAPNVLVWSAVAASCSLPILFTPVSVLAKNPKTGLAEPWNASPQKWIDGSIDNDLPMTRLAEMFNVNHFIVSQVNPHVVPFLEKEPSRPLSSQSSGSQGNTYEGWKSTIVSLAMGEALHRINVLAEMGIFTTSLTKAKSILSQKYAGDITIFPEVPVADLQKLIRNPTPEFMIEASLRGEKATWPRLSRIRNCCAIELALDRCIHQLRTKVVFSGSLSDLRLNTNEANKNDRSNDYLPQSRTPNTSRKRPVTGDPSEFALFSPPPPPPALPIVASFEAQLHSRLSYPPPTTRGRSHSTGPPQLPQFSPAFTRNLGTDKGYFDATAGKPPGSPNSSRSSLSMNSAKVATIKPPSNSSGSNRSSAHIESPKMTKQYTDEATGFPLRRTGSRYRLVRQTPSSELDPADAEDESGALAGSSEDEDPFQLPESLDDHGGEESPVAAYFSDQAAGMVSSPASYTVSTPVHSARTTDSPLSLQKRPFASRSATVLPLYSTYLPNDALYSAKLHDSLPSSELTSPVGTFPRSAHKAPVGRFDFGQDSNED